MPLLYTTQPFSSCQLPPLPYDVAGSLGNSKENVQETLPLHSRWERLARARAILVDHSVGLCCAGPRYGRESVGVRALVGDDGHRRHYFAGLARCKNPVCPVCGPRMAKERAALLSRLVAAVGAAGDHASMLTLTVQHGRDDDPFLLREKFFKARRILRNRKAWKVFSRSVGMVGDVASFEVTYGASGWHLHTHEVLVTADLVPGASEVRWVNGRKRLQHTGVAVELLAAWQAACKSVGLVAGSVGVHLRTADEEVAEYVSKFGLSKEVTGITQKGGREYNLTPLQILDKSFTAPEYAVTYLQFSEVFRGVRWLRWSKGLADHYGIVKVSPDLVRHEEVDYILKEDWRAVVRMGAESDVLREYDTRGKASAYELIKKCRADAWEEFQQWVFLRDCEMILSGQVWRECEAVDVPDRDELRDIFADLLALEQLNFEFG